MRLTQIATVAVVAVVAVVALIWWLLPGEPRDFLGELQARNPTVVNLELSPDALKLEEDRLQAGKGETRGKPSTSSVRQKFTVADGVDAEDVVADLVRRGRLAGFDMKTFGTLGSYIGSNEIGDSLKVLSRSGRTGISFTLSDTIESAREAGRG